MMSDRHSRIASGLLVLSVCCAALIHCVKVEGGSEAKEWKTAERINDIGGRPGVVIDPNGNAVAVWPQRRRDMFEFWQMWSSRYSPTAGWDAAEHIGDADIFGRSFIPGIAVDPDGHVVVVWAQTDGTRFDIWSNRYTPDSRWGTAERIETNDGGDAFGPQVAVDAGGNAVAVWHQSDGTRDNIWSNRYSPTAGWGTPERIEADNAGDAADAQVAIDASGNAVAVWHQSDGTRHDIWSNRYEGGWGIAERIEADNAGDALGPQVAVDASGNAIAVWHQSNGTREDIWSNRYEEGWGTAERIETDDQGDALNPQIAMDPSGNAMVVWEQFNGATFDIWSRRYEGGWGTAGRIETDDQGDALRPWVAVGPEGSAVAVWKQFDGTSEHIWSNRYERRWGTAQRIQEEPLGDGPAAWQNPRVAIGPEGNAMAVWPVTTTWGDHRHGVWANRLE